MLSSPTGGSAGGIGGASGGMSGTGGMGGGSIGIGTASAQTVFLNNVSGGALDAFPGLLGKRVATWRYLQRVYQGGMVLYNTAMLSDEDLRHSYTDEKMQRR